MSEKITIDVVQNVKELLQAFDLRRASFVKAQHISEEKEFDGNDFSATHIIAKVGDKVIGTQRVRYFKDFVKMERLCIAPEYRKKNVAQRILDFTAQMMKEKGYEKAYCFCVPELLTHWQKNHCERVTKVPEINYDGMRLLLVRVDFGKSSLKDILKSPQLLLHKEGHQH